MSRSKELTEEHAREAEAQAYLGFAEAGGDQAPRADVEVPLLPALIVRIQSRDPPVQCADDHQRPGNPTGILRNVLDL